MQSADLVVFALTVLYLLLSFEEELLLFDADAEADAEAEADADAEADAEADDEDPPIDLI